MTVSVEQIEPFEGVGKLRFGQSRATTRTFFDVEPRVFVKTHGEVPADAYSGEGTHLYFDSAGQLEFIEMFSPRSLTLLGIPLLGRRFEQVVTDLSAAGVRCELDEIGADCPRHGVGLTAEQGVVTGVAVYRRGLYSSSD